MAPAGAAPLLDGGTGRDWTQLVFLSVVMNMLFGSGPLTLPRAFFDAGLFYSVAFLLFFAVIAYVTAMCARGLLHGKLRRVKTLRGFQQHSGARSGVSISVAVQSIWTPFQQSVEHFGRF